MRAEKPKLVTSAPEGKNHDPSVHSDLNEAGLNVHEFAVVAFTAFCSRRRNGDCTVSHPNVAKACQISQDAVKRARKTSVKDGRFMTLAATSQGVTNTYKLTPGMSWGESGCKIWLPEELWNLELDPYELRLYCHYVCTAKRTGRTVIDRAEIERCCRISIPKQRAADAGLMAAGLVRLVGYEDKKPALELRPSDEWTGRGDRQTVTYSEAKRNVSPGSEANQKETSALGTQAKRNVSPGKKKRQHPKSNTLNTKPFNAKKGFEVEQPKPTNAQTFFTELLGEAAYKGFKFYLKTDIGDPDAELQGWFKQLGEPTIRQAWAIIQDTVTALDYDPQHKHGKNLRLIKFCRGELHGIYDPHTLCELHNKTQPSRYPEYKPAPAPETRDEQPPMDVETYVPRLIRARQALAIKGVM